MKRYVPNFRPPSKYRAQKTTVDGIAFDSKAEAARYQQLKQDKRAGKIRWFTRQPSFILGAMWVEDVKGFETEGFRLKRDLWRETFRGLPLRIIKNGKVMDE